MKHWVQGTDDIELPTENFFREIEAICRKYGLSISHEDSHGAFVIVPFDPGDMECLSGAVFTTDAARVILRTGQTE